MKTPARLGGGGRGEGAAEGRNFTFRSHLFFQVTFPPKRENLKVKSIPYTVFMSIISIASLKTKTVDHALNVN